MLVQADQFNSIAEAFHMNALKLPDAPFYREGFLKGDWSRPETLERDTRVIDRATAQTRVNRTADWLAREGIRPGEHIGVISLSRGAYVETDIGIYSAGCVGVPVHEAYDSTVTARILKDADVTTVFIDTQQQADKLIQAMSDGNAETRLSLKKIVTFEEVVVPAEWASKFRRYQDIINDQSLSSMVPDIVWSLTPESVANIVYTSGRTSDPKGVIHSHGGHLANVRQAREAGLFKPGERIFMGLPLAHAFTRLMEYVAAKENIEMVFTTVVNLRASMRDKEHFLKDISQLGSTLFPIAPKLLQAMREKILEHARGEGMRARLLRNTLRYYLAKKDPDLAKLIDPEKSQRRTSAELLVDCAAPLYARAIATMTRRRLFGSAVRQCISGGAKLSQPVAEFFRALGLRLLNGWGQTEFAVAANCTRNSTRLDTVGPPLANDILERIGENNEILVSSPSMGLGYYKRPEKTAQTWFTDAAGRKWCRSGDTGSIDSAGNLTITGGLNERIVLSNGEKPDKDRIAELLCKSTLISEAVVVGSDRPCCVALVVIREDIVRAKLAQAGVQAIGQLESEPKVQALLEQELRRLNLTKQLAYFEEPQAVILVPADRLSVANGTLTPTHKICLPKLEKMYAAELNQIYLRLGSNGRPLSKPV